MIVALALLTASHQLPGAERVLGKSGGRPCGWGRVWSRLGCDLVGAAGAARSREFENQ